MTAAHGAAAALKDHQALMLNGDGSTECSAGGCDGASSSLILPLAAQTDQDKEESRRRGSCEDTGDCLAAAVSYAPIEEGTESREALIAPLPAEEEEAISEEEEGPGGRVAVVQQHHHCGCWAWLSHFFFLGGSLLYFWLAVWDIRDESTWYDDDDDDDNSITLRSWRSLTFITMMDRHTLLSAAAALCYVGDAGVTTAQLPIIYFRHSNKITRQVLFFMGNSITFGLGAILEFTSAVTEVSHLEISNWTAVVAMHAYLVNAAIVLFFKKRRKHHGYCGGVPVTFSERLELLGDVLFGVGCSVDVSLSYYYNDRTTDNEWIWVDRGNLVSAVLWLVDSILYIAADFYYFNHIEEEDGQELMVDHSLSGRFREPLISSIDSEDEFAVEIQGQPFDICNRTFV